MLLKTLLAAFLVAIPFTLSSPTSDPDYSCGYVLTAPNENVYAGLSDESCTGFFFNSTINDFQDAYAYHLFGGCKCAFFELSDECEMETCGNESWIQGPTSADYWEVLYFKDPKPKWYACLKD